MSVEWYPSRLLLGGTVNPYALVILNQPLNGNALHAVMEGASLMVCADAGADRLYQYDVRLREGTKQRLPDAIVGDLDSLTSNVERHYRSKGVRVEKDPDQYSTDFTKCLKWLRREWESRSESPGSVLDVVVLGGLGGRVDQGFSQIHHLYMAARDKSLLNGRIYLLSEQSLSFVLDDGVNVVHIEPDTFEENVGIIPVLGQILLTTRGLEWDVEEWPSDFGGQVSTSNHIKSDRLEIQAKGGNPLFTLELAKRFSASGE